jgi:hypothetical protein
MKAYDRPDISPLQFLLAVMHDSSLPIATRTKAASLAAPYVWPKDREPSLTIKIEGFPSIEFMKDLLYIKRCWEAGILPDPDSWEIVGGIQ